MNIRDLKYLVALADHGQFSLAAAASFVTQPALSMQIQKLEKLLGIQLIERTGKAALLTDMGKIITQEARAILMQVDNIKEIALKARDPYSGELSLGVIPTVAPYLLPHIIPKMSKTLPKVTFYLLEDKTAHLLARLKAGHCDCAILRLPLLEEDWMCIPLFKEEFLLAVSAKHIFSTKKSIHFSDLENKALLLLEDGHCMREDVLEFCYKVKAKDARFQATSLETLRHMVASNAGMTLLPQLARQATDGIVYIPFQSPKPTRTLGLVFRRSSAKKILFERLAEEIKKQMAKLKSVTVV